MDSLSPDQLRARAKDAQEKLVVRLEDELEKLIKMVSFARDALNNELFSGMGYKGEAVSEKDLKKLKELTISMNSLIDSKIRYDKARKQLAASMTPEEEMSAVVTYIKSLDVDAYKRFRNRLADQGIIPWKS